MKQCNRCDKFSCQIFEGNKRWPEDRPSKTKESRMAPEHHNISCKQHQEPRSGFPFPENISNIRLFKDPTHIQRAVREYASARFK